MKMFDKNLMYFDEPELEFGLNQKAIDVRDGLLLFGPNERFSEHSIRAGVVGTQHGINLYSSFVSLLNAPIFSTKTVYGKTKSDEVQRPSFPGFEAVFDVKWLDIPEIQAAISESKIEELLNENLKKKENTEFSKFVRRYNKENS